MAYFEEVGISQQQQVDVLPSKNQALCDLIYNVLYNYIN